MKRSFDNPINDNMHISQFPTNLLETLCFLLYQTLVVGLVRRLRNKLGFVPLPKLTNVSYTISHKQLNLVQDCDKLSWTTFCFSVGGCSIEGYSYYFYFESFQNCTSPQNGIIKRLVWDQNGSMAQQEKKSINLESLSNWRFDGQILHSIFSIMKASRSPTK